MRAPYISIGCYEIELTLTSVITALEDRGALADIMPDAEFGYCCEAVYGVPGNAIAAVHMYGDQPDDIVFQLLDGSLFAAASPYPLARPTSGWKPH